MMEDTYNHTPHSLTLEQFCTQIKYVVEQGRLEAWVTAEIGQITTSRGHYYIELVQKSEDFDAPSAKLRCNIWSSMVDDVLRDFRAATGGDLCDGMKIMAYIKTTFHTVFGMSGLILAIDPNYTLGDIEARRQSVWRQLQAEGVADMNKSLPLPAVIRNIAVVSAETAAGYGDFCDQLRKNQYGIKFHTTLFQAYVQGTGAEASVVNALERIAERADEFDIVAIIRGGGSKMDLACFDSYEIANNIAQFPLPVITGIGHERDRSIADMVAHTSVKTPTAVAEYLIGIDCEFLALMDEYELKVKQAWTSKVNSQKLKVEGLAIRVISGSASIVSRAKSQIEALQARAVNSAKNNIGEKSHILVIQEMRIRTAMEKYMAKEALSLDSLRDTTLKAVKRRMSTELMKLDNYERRIKTSDPRAITSRGYSITTDTHGNRITAQSQVKPGDTIVTHLQDGKVTSTVTEAKTI